ncbi:MAG: hypothetical protein CBC58_04710 [Cellulomonadaceae bacterium TMED98]|jgi:hypothetical protein|nr:MAG: hypothetical protein CBC58_04710 [Cellulomonadaceae bacterium TMED98]
MKLGGRFDIGKLADSLPEPLASDVRKIEEELTEDERQSKRWTLTWLEGRAVVELDDGPTLRG